MGLMSITIQLRDICKMNEIIYGDNARHFELLQSYYMIVVRCNPGSKIKIQVDSTCLRPKFERLYICFKACTYGFVNGCIPFFRLDGSHILG